MTASNPIASACLLAALSVSAFFAQSATSGSGHWKGAIELPDKKLDVEVDLAKAGEGWIGSIAIPEQKIKAFPLADIGLQGTSIKFSMKGIPGDPTFRGTLSSDGQSIAGDFTQGGGSFPFVLKLAGEAKVELPAKSTSIGKEFLGTWEGALQAGDVKRRLVLKLSNQPDGTGAASLVSVDQNGVEIPVTTVTQTGLNLKVDVKLINALYTGELKGDDQIVGEWSQNGANLPLTFKRAAKPESKQ